MSAVEFKDVELTLNGERIYDNVTFSIHEGEFVCILGPSGCGKSTSLRIMGDLLEYDGGEVNVKGLRPADAWSEIAFVFQSPRLAPWRNVLDNLMLGVDLRFGSGEARQRVGAGKRLLEMVGLGDAGGKYPWMLSGGERQRVAIGRALAVEPSIMLMDEPFSALDPNTRRRLRVEVERIWLETGITVVFVTHDIDEAISLADRIIVLSPKPTQVVEIVEIDAARPRTVMSDPALQDVRIKLNNLFLSIEGK
ncbi:ABC transporter ATP-binding protein [Tardiphaga sp. 215_C5_N2_1]|uniref:ABC transporter ATP-binding protein n=1 Tax=Tardiphaga sp. 215_C5_N2_1 TaxID=3240774 RepID=UPI003F896739